MAKLPRLQITVGPDGAVTTDFSHFVGPNCLEAGKRLHALLAELGVQSEVTGMTPKPELLASSPTDVQAVMQPEELTQEGGQ